MTRFETKDGKQLGVKFFGGEKLGCVKFLTKTELETLWNLDEDELVVSDNNWFGTVADLKDLLFNLNTCTELEMVKRGWGDRLEQGLHFQKAVNAKCELIWVR